MGSSAGGSSAGRASAGAPRGGRAAWWLAAAAALLLAAPLAEAEPFRFEAGVLEIPAGFIGPTEQRRGSELALYGFAKPHPGRETSTLLQVTVLTLPSGAADLPQDEEARAAEKYLLELLAGVARRRTEFVRGDVETIVIDGKAVARVGWRGRADGQQMTGVMYCYLHGRRRLVSFHTQDVDSAPAENRAAAVRAFETATLAERPGPGAPKR
jgi:hypothetical protein